MQNQALLNEYDVARLTRMSVASVRRLAAAWAGTEVPEDWRGSAL